MRNWLLTTTLLLAAAATAHAATGDVETASWERETVSRSWQDQYSPMTANLRMYLTRRVRQSDGRYRDERFHAWIRLDIRVSSAQLRTGEKEEFEVEARSWSHQGDDPVVDITVRATNAYHRYFREQKRIVVRNRGTNWERMSLYAGSRIREAAPTTVDKMTVNLTTPAEPVTFTWRDYAAGENPGTTTEFRFRVGRVRSVFQSDVIVANGDLGQQNQVSVTPDSSFTENHDEYFQEGKKYRLVVWMRRMGSDIYTEEWGDAEWGTFKFEQGQMVLEAGSEGIQFLLPEQEKFRALHATD